MTTYKVTPHILILFLALASSLLLTSTAPGADTKQVSSAERDTVVTGCELYLFGRLVEPIPYRGQPGIRVKRTATTVTINDIVYFDTNAPRPQPIISPEVLAKSNAESAVVEPVAQSVREAVTYGDGDSVLVNGKRPRFGTKILHSRAADGANVWIEYTASGFWVTYKDNPVFFSYRMPSRIDPMNEGRHPDEILSEVYRHVVFGLKPGAIVLIGKGYMDTYFIPDRHDDLRRAIALIPARAKRIDGADLYGLINYEPLDIGGFHFMGDVVRDFVSVSTSTNGKGRQ